MSHDLVDRGGAEGVRGPILEEPLVQDDITDVEDKCCRCRSAVFLSFSEFSLLSL